MHNVSKLSHESQNILSKCKMVTLKIIHFCEIFKTWFLTPNPGFHVQYKNKLKLCTLFATNCKYNPSIFSQTHQIFLHVLPGNTYWYKNPKNPILKFSLLKTTKKFHHNNTRPTWPERPSNIITIMYEHLWSNIAHFQDTAQMEPHVQNFEISKFELFALKIQKCSILFFWDLRHYLGPKIQQIDEKAQNLYQNPDHHSMHQILQFDAYRWFKWQNTTCSKSWARGVLPFKSPENITSNGQRQLHLRHCIQPHMQDLSKKSPFSSVHRGGTGQEVTGHDGTGHFCHDFFFFFSVSCSNITNDQLGISGETGMVAQISVFVNSAATCHAVVQIYSWCVTPHSSPTRGGWPQPINYILNIFIFNYYIH